MFLTKNNAIHEHFDKYINPKRGFQGDSSNKKGLSSLNNITNDSAHF